MSSVSTIVKVGISDLNIVKSPNTIRTSGLGSCVGAVIYDLQQQIAGLAHVMLPDSTQTKQTPINLHKYADTAIPELVELLLKNGARKFALKAKIAGGAQMFSFGSNSEVMRVGPRNAEAVQKAIKAYQIPIVASDIGGNSGRTIEFSPDTGKLKIKTVNHGEQFI
ncbi:chemotaxis protein CheD [Ornithinibacillus sp. 4-3]|uniref:Probable chemoreceptor glutamine deamidase CheD n=1 Tax=Ornithinibacillus sp. 4-3 TaxID=3231488 RepID=A0AB39HW09_9BACI